MESYTGSRRYPAPLSFPSMSGGNTIADPRGHALAMAGAGSDSVNPLPDRLDNYQLPVLPADQIPVSNMAKAGRVTVPGGGSASGAAPWSDVNDPTPPSGGPHPNNPPAAPWEEK